TKEIIFLTKEIIFLTKEIIFLTKEIMSLTKEIVFQPNFLTEIPPKWFWSLILALKFRQKRVWQPGSAEKFEQKPLWLADRWPKVVFG
ncbi:MAG TPA: hypothetical protein VGF13_11260, partial [Verrucomicrobiae bacterium]